MKIFALAFLATVFCATVAFAAPQLSDDFTVEEVPFGIQDKIEEILKLYQCAREVIDEALGESGLDEDLRRFAKAFENLGKVELGKCKTIENKLKKFTCTMTGALKFSKLFAEFTKTMTEKNAKLLEKVYKEYETKCLKNTTPF